MRLALFSLLLCLALSQGVAAPWTEGRLEAMAAAEMVVRAQVEELEVDLPEMPDLDRYEAEFRSAVPQDSPLDVDPREFALQLEAAPLVFLSDLHTARISQANTVRILKQMARGKNLALVIEWVDRDDQPALDAFLAGRMTLEDLKRAVEFDTLWGFPWEGYSKILQTARKLRVPVLAVDSLRTHLPLGERDQRITDTLSAHRKSHPGTRYLVVYGCFHLAGKGHLPDRMLAAGFPSGLALVGDAPRAFWKALKRHGDPSLVRFLKLAPGLYYIRNGTPLEREVSYRDYLLEMVGMEEDELTDQLDEVLSDPALLFEELHRMR